MSARRRHIWPGWTIGSTFAPARPRDSREERDHHDEWRRSARLCFEARRLESGRCSRRDGERLLRVEFSKLSSVWRARITHSLARPPSSMKLDPQPRRFWGKFESRLKARARRARNCAIKVWPHSSSSGSSGKGGRLEAPASQPVSIRLSRVRRHRLVAPPRREPILPGAFSRAEQAPCGF